MAGRKRPLRSSSRENDPESITAAVAAHISRAMQAVRDQNMQRIIESLDAAVALYEQHPSQAHEPDSHLRDLLVFIRTTRSICKKLGEPEDDLRELEGRAEALRKPLH